MKFYNDFLKTSFYFLVICLSPLSLHAMEKEKRVINLRDIPENVAFEMKDLVYDIVITHQEGDSPVLNYFSNSPSFYPNEGTVAKIETAFMLHLVKKSKVLQEKFDADQLNCFMNHALHFARYTKENSPKYRLKRLFEDLRELDACIPPAPQTLEMQQCCSKTIHNTDSLDKQIIQDKVEKFYSNTLPLWNSLNTATKNSITPTEFIEIRHRIFIYYMQRLTGYNTSSCTQTKMHKKFIPAAVTFSSGLGLGTAGLFFKTSALAFPALGCCCIGVFSLMLLQSNEEQECIHHDQNKVKDLVKIISNGLKNFEFYIKSEKLKK